MVELGEEIREIKETDFSQNHAFSPFRYFPPFVYYMDGKVELKVLTVLVGEWMTASDG